MEILRSLGATGTLPYIEEHEGTGAQHGTTTYVVHPWNVRLERDPWSKNGWRGHHFRSERHGWELLTWGPSPREVLCDSVRVVVSRAISDLARPGLR
jgi:hypothetical protein